MLRDPRLEMAFLEVARGGILRRGLPTRQARVACVTNVAADHLGQYGVNTVPELARAKFSVHRALAKEGILVLNADDNHIVTEAAKTRANICWFSLNQSADQIVLARKNGQACAWLQDGCIRFFDGQTITSVIDVADIPITLSGAAQYNVLNALAATCVTRAMGIQDSAIRAGLAGFQNDPTDNPGRLNTFSIGGAQLFVDFAHNPHSIAAVAQTLLSIPAKRRIVMLSHAGDRSDQDIRQVTEIALGLDPEVVVAAELPQYLRGREPGEVTELMVENLPVKKVCRMIR